MEKTRIAITGLGLMCAVGKNRQEAWENVAQGVCGIGEIQLLDTLWLGARIAGEVRDFDPNAYLGDEADPIVRSAQFAIIAAQEALDEAGIDIKGIDPYRVGLVLGTCQGSIAEQKADNPHLVDGMHVSADEVAHHFDIRGPRIVVSTACSAGANAIGLARDKLWNDEADVVLAGGMDALTFFSLSGFNAVGSLDTQPCSPYSRSGGLSLGEGSGILVLERMDRAVERGAPILAELLGYGLSADAYHPSAPDPSGRGATLAMRRAMRQAGITPDDVDYVNGHGTATAANDAMERKALRNTFGERAPEVPCSSSKSMIGHTLGAAGAIEAGFCVMSTMNDLLPPTVNFDTSLENEYDFVPNEARPAKVDIAMSNNYAFGGNNASVVIAKPGLVDPVAAGPALAGADVVITGLGAVGPLGVGVEEWWDALANGRSGIVDITSFDARRYGFTRGGEPPKLDARGFAPGGVWRKLDMLGRQCVAASRLAWRHANLDPGSDEMERIGVFFGTNAGSLETMQAFDRAARRGPSQANPILFPNTTLNSAAGHVCTLLGVRGPTSTITSGGISGVVALAYAADMIRQGEMDTAVVVAGDVLGETTFGSASTVAGLLTDEPIRPFDERATGTALSGATIAVVLESAAHAAARQAEVYCRVLGSGMSGSTFDHRGVGWADTDWVEAIRLAVERSGISAADIGYTAAAACGVRAVDAVEALAINKVLGDESPVGAPKSMAGECLGASGLVNVVAAVMALRQGVLAPTMNLEEPLRDNVLAHVANEAGHADVEYALVNSMAVGGNYASVVLGR